jgi:hypothetical protein
MRLGRDDSFFARPLARLESRLPLDHALQTRIERLPASSAPPPRPKSEIRTDPVPPLDGRSVIIHSVWDVPVALMKLGLATGRREGYMTLGPPDLTGAIQIAPIALSDDGLSHAYTVRRMSSHLFLVGGAS